jgi:hypothetical protein
MQWSLLAGNPWRLTENDLPMPYGRQEKKQEKQEGRPHEKANDFGLGYLRASVPFPFRGFAL